jgi:hypothetical protein
VRVTMEGYRTIALFTRMYGTCAWEASIRQRKLRRVPYIWSGTALDPGQVSIVRQLIKPGLTPIFGSLKNGEGRTISIAPETAILLRKHKAHRAELKLVNRTHYHDHGLVFAKEWEHLRRHSDTLGYRLQMNNLGQNEYRKLVKQAGVRLIRLCLKNQNSE